VLTTGHRPGGSHREPRRPSPPSQRLKHNVQESSMALWPVICRLAIKNDSGASLRGRKCVIARQCAWAREKALSPASLISNTFPRASLSDKTSRCECRCADLRGSQMPFQKSWRITSTPWRCISCTTTFAVFISRFALRQRWKRASAITFGAWRS
jgi:hypothetical protein